MNILLISLSVSRHSCHPFWMVTADPCHWRIQWGGLRGLQPPPLIFPKKCVIIRATVVTDLVVTSPNNACLCTWNSVVWIEPSLARACGLVKTRRGRANVIQLVDSARADRSLFSHCDVGWFAWRRLCFSSMLKQTSMQQFFRGYVSDKKMQDNILRFSFYVRQS